MNAFHRFALAVSMQFNLHSAPNMKPLKGGARCPQRALVRSLSRQRLGDKPLHLRLHRYASAALMLVVCSVPPTALAWGPGHDDVMRTVLKGLPEELRATFTAEIEKEMIEKDSHFPDSFDALRVEETGASALQRLTAARI